MWDRAIGISVHSTPTQSASGPRGRAPFEHGSLLDEYRVVGFSLVFPIDESYSTLTDLAPLAEDFFRAHYGRWDELHAVAGVLGSLKVVAGAFTIGMGPLWMATFGAVHCGYLHAFA